MKDATPTFRVLSDTEIENLNAELTQAVVDMTADSAVSEEKFRSVVLNSLAGTLAATARSCLRKSIRKRGLSLSDEDVRDLASEAMVRLMDGGRAHFRKARKNAKRGVEYARKMGERRPRHEIVRYLYKTVHDVCWQILRDELRRLNRGGMDVERELEEAPHIDTDDSGEDRLAEVEQIEGIRKILSDDDYALVWLVGVAGYTTEEAAEYFGTCGVSGLLTPSDVRNRWSDILRRCGSSGS